MDKNQHNLEEIECLPVAISATLDAFRSGSSQIRPISGRTGARVLRKKSRTFRAIATNKLAKYRAIILNNFS